MRSVAPLRWSAVLALVLSWSPCAIALEYRPQMAQVIRVIDGDTFVMSFPAEREDVEHRANLIGVDAPGRGESECEAQHVTSIAKRLLAGKKVWVDWDSGDKRTSDGRLLTYIAHPDDRTADLNALYIEQGWGWVPRAYPADRKSEYLELEHKARQQERGIWGGPCPPGVTEGSES